MPGHKKTSSFTTTGSLDNANKRYVLSFNYFG
jgi:hypothetical protein